MWEIIVGIVSMIAVFVLFIWYLPWSVDREIRKEKREHDEMLAAIYKEYNDKNSRTIYADGFVVGGLSMECD